MYVPALLHVPWCITTCGLSDECAVWQMGCATNNLSDEGTVWRTACPTDDKAQPVLVSALATVTWSYGNISRLSDKRTGRLTNGLSDECAVWRIGCVTNGLIYAIAFLPQHMHLIWRAFYFPLHELRISIIHGRPISLWLAHVPILVSLYPEPVLVGLTDVSRVTRGLLVCWYTQCVPGQVQSKLLVSPRFKMEI